MELKLLAEKTPMDLREPAVAEPLAHRKLEPEWANSEWFQTWLKLARRDPEENLN